MPSVLEVIAVIGVVIVVLIILLVVQILIAPELVMGTLSIPIPQMCNGNTQWVLYDCKPNPTTGWGCVIPGSGGRYITNKNIAIKTSPCLPDANGNVGGERIISFRWQEVTTTACQTSGKTCCEYNGSCAREVSYACQTTDVGAGGENQCTPSFLPAPAPDYDGNTDYSTPNPPLKISVPCKENYCTS